MSTNSSFESDSSHLASKKRCKYQKISKDQQKRLKSAFDEIDKLKSVIKQQDDYISDLLGKCKEIEYQNNENVRINESLEKKYCIERKKKKELKSIIINHRKESETLHQNFLNLETKYIETISKLKSLKAKYKDKKSMFSSRQNVDEIFSLKNENQELRTDLLSYRKAFEETKFQHEIESQKMRNDATNRVDIHEYNVLVQKCDSLKEENNKLYNKSMKYKESKKQNQILLEENSSLKSQIEKIHCIRSKIQYTEAQMHELQHSLNELKEENHSLKMKINLQSDNSNNGISKKIQDQLSTITIERDSLLRDVNRLEDKVDRLKFVDSQNTELKIKLEEMQFKLTDYENQCTLLNEKLSLLSQERYKINETRNKIQTIKENIEERESIEQDYRSQLIYYKTQVRELKKQISKYEKKLFSRSLKK